MCCMVNLLVAWFVRKRCTGAVCFAAVPTTPFIQPAFVRLRRVLCVVSHVSVALAILNLACVARKTAPFVKFKRRFKPLLEARWPTCSSSSNRPLLACHAEQILCYRLIDIIWMRVYAKAWARTEECCIEFLRFGSCLFTQSRLLLTVYVACS